MYSPQRVCSNANYSARCRSPSSVGRNHHSRRRNAGWISPSSMNINSRDENSGQSTPPLWRSHSPGSLSPSSRLEAIARGQRELMEMVENMSESTYELSLRDIVEVRRADQVDQKGIGQEKKVLPKRRSHRKDLRSCRFANRGDFLLKMSLPFTVRKSQSGNGRVSPVKGGDVDWWKKRGSCSGSSGTSRSCSWSSSKSAESRSAACAPISCWYFLPRKNDKNLAFASKKKDIL